MSAPSTPVDSGNCNSLAIAYKPSHTGNIVVGAIYGIVGLLLVWRTISTRQKWAGWLPFACLASAAGFFLRLKIDPCDLSVGLFAIAQLLVLVSPCGIIAFNYMLFKRLLVSVDPEFAQEATSAMGKRSDGEKVSKMRLKSQYSPLPPLLVGRFFVTSDLVTFLIQCGGGGLTARASSADLGTKLFLIGVSAQAGVYAFYIVFFALLASKLKKAQVADYAPGSGGIKWGKDLRSFVILVFVSSVFILIRSVFRVIEFAQGHGGELVSHEAYLFALDVAPLIISATVWLIFWPLHTFARLSDEVGGGAYSLPLTAGKDMSPNESYTASAPAVGSQYPQQGQYGQPAPYAQSGGAKGYY